MNANTGRKCLAVTPYGLLIDRPVADWITAALELRISPRGNDAEEAVDDVVAMVRDFASTRATAIAIERRQKTVRRELREDEGYQ